MRTHSAPANPVSLPPFPGGHLAEFHVWSKIGQESILKVLPSSGILVLWDNGTENPSLCDCQLGELGTLSPLSGLLCPHL